MYTVFLVLSGLVAIALILFVFFTGKGDAMSGGSNSVRTSFKGKASFDDRVSQITMSLGLSYMVLMVILSIVRQG